MTAAVRSGSVKVKGVELAYREAGSGRPLVLVHGNLASGRWFHEQLAAPPAGWHLLAPDLPNFGASAAMPGPIEISSYAGYLAALCDGFGFERPALLGHSLGGAVVQALATTRPDAVDRVLLVASPGPAGHSTPEDHYPFLASLPGDRVALARALAATMPSRLPPYFDELVDDALAMAEPAFTGNGRALERFDVSGRCRRFCSPLLVLRGRRDLPHLITEEIARLTAAAYPKSRLELWEEVGHSPQIEAPERFNRLLAGFLEEPP